MALVGLSLFLWVPMFTEINDDEVKNKEKQKLKAEDKKGKENDERTKKDERIEVFSEELQKQQSDSMNNN